MQAVIGLQHIPHIEFEEDPQNQRARTPIEQQNEHEVGQMPHYNRAALRQQQQVLPRRDRQL